MCLEKFSKNLSLLLKENNLKQTDLAKRIGASDTAVCYWIQGRKEPTLSYLCKIKETLNCSYDELME